MLDGKNVKNREKFKMDVNGYIFMGKPIMSQKSHRFYIE